MTIGSQLCSIASTLCCATLATSFCAALFGPEELRQLDVAQFIFLKNQTTACAATGHVVKMKLSQKTRQRVVSKTESF